jgi:hypothetical protein
MRRSFLALAAGVLASLAFATPTQAGSLVYTSSFTLTGAAATEIALIASAPITSITGVNGTVLPVTTTYSAGNTIVSFTFAAHTSGTLNFTIDIPGGGVVTSYIAAYQGGNTPTISSFNFAVNPVPEPTSMALLGIGMASFFTYRRLFKKISV